MQTERQARAKPDATGDLEVRYDAPEAAPLPRARGRGTLRDRIYQSPSILLLAYYTTLILVVWVLVAYVPAVRQAFVTPVALPGASGGSFFDPGSLQGTPTGPMSLADVLERALTTLLSIVGALATVVPVAWLYMRTKRLRYDPSLVRSVIILPIVVAGITLVVKNSIALAFSLAGIVAAVRFRNTLKDPRDAVYVFLAIGIGLSAGVQALDVAVVMSMAFNFLVLALWKYNIGSLYGGSYRRTGVLSTGSSALLVAQAPERRKQIRRSLLDEADQMQTTGILLVHVRDAELARLLVQEALSDLAKDWRLVRIVPRGEGLSTLEYLIHLKKKSDPAELIGALDERWSAQMAAAEYLPFRVRQRSRDGADGERGD